MNINDKIKQILIDKNLTPSYFADEIGVQRSSISHILSGRNRPSFDIIQKIIRRFPELGYEWIMEEDPQQGYNAVGQVNFGAPGRAAQPVGVNQYERIAPQSGVSFPAATTSRNQRNELPPIHQQQQPPLPASFLESTASAPALVPATQVDKKVERILIFYTDGSFREYSPS